MNFVVVQSHGPEGITVTSVSPVQWDNETQFSMPNRGSRVDGKRFRVEPLGRNGIRSPTTADSDHDEDAIEQQIGDVAQTRASVRGGCA